MTEPRRPSAGLVDLVDANAPLWAGEAEVFRTYWDWDGRSPATDRQWLARQCHKELFDGFLPRLSALDGGWAGIGESRAEVLELSKSAYEELAHYCAFAAAYDAIRDNDVPLDIDTLRACAWPENAALAELRAAHIRDHGELGRRAQAFTEGGYCTLFSEGVRLRGRGGVDDMVADACALVYADEWEHMLLGIAGLAGLDDGDGARSPEAWAVLRDLSVAQMEARIRMRNAQFSFPLPEVRVAAILAGDVVPLAFDYRRAGLAVPTP
ncbi:MAG: hypothetical protein QOG82_220 [Actinomycetota bacterium]|nr:hypothetical protein [Actinomycetota bacterium]